MTRREEILRAVSQAATVHAESRKGPRTSSDVIGAVAERNIPLLFRPLDKLWGAFITVNDEERGIIVTIRLGLPVQTIHGRPRTGPSDARTQSVWYASGDPRCRFAAAVQTGGIAARRVGGSVEVTPAHRTALRQQRRRHPGEHARTRHHERPDRSATRERQEAIRRVGAKSTGPCRYFPRSSRSGTPQLLAEHIH